MSVIKSLEILLKADNKMLRSDLGKALRDIDSFSSKVNKSTGGIFSSALARQGLLINGNAELLASAIEADRVFQKVGGTISRLLKVGLVAGVTASVGLFVSSLRQAIETERWTVKLAFLSRGGAKLGIALRDEFRKMAIKSPFAEEQLFESASRLMGAGISSKEVVGLVKSLGDAAAASGTQLNQLALVFSQVFAKDVLQGEEMLQFMERNITLNRELRKVMGVDTVEALKELQAQGKIGPGDVAKAFKNMTEEGGRFKDGMLIASKTTQGQFTVLNNLFKIFKDQIGQQVLPIVNELFLRLTELGESGQLREWAISIGKGFAYFARAVIITFRAVGTLIKSFSELEFKIVAALAVAATITPLIMKVVRGFKHLRTAIISAKAFMGPAGWKDLAVGIGVFASTLVALEGIDASVGLSKAASELERIDKIVGTSGSKIDDDIEALLKVGEKLKSGTVMGGGSISNTAAALFGSREATKAILGGIEKDQILKEQLRVQKELLAEAKKQKIIKDADGFKGERDPRKPFKFVPVGLDYYDRG